MKNININPNSLKNLKPGAFKGRHHTKETKEKISQYNIGRKHPHIEKTKEKISLSLIGNHRRKGKKHPHTEEVKKKISKGMVGKNIWSKGCKFSEETKKKISLANKGKLKPEGFGKKISERQKGEKSSLWKGGISFEKYGFDWTNLLKHSIRTRDCFICQICKKNGWVIHHIDYKKKNCNPNNLITLCRSCHAKTNFNREYWINYFNNLI